MKLFKALLLIAVLSSCSKEKNGVELAPAFSDPNWTRIEIANGKEAHAVYGNLDDTLTVSTLYDIRQTYNKGKTWINVKTTHQPFYGLLVKGDSIFTLSSKSLKIQSGQVLTSFSQYLSVDKGSSWKSFYEGAKSINRSKEYATVYPNNQLAIRLKENLEPINGDPTHNSVLKSTVEIIENGNARTLLLPFNNQITNLYLDEKGRLYVSATSAIYDKTSGKYSDNEKAEPAIIYVSKQNISTLIK